MDTTEESIKKICESYGCKILFDEPLSAHTTFGTGGNAKGFIPVSSSGAVCGLIRYFNENNVKYTVLGRGSNVIAADEGYDGYILDFGKDFSKCIPDEGDPTVFIAEAGTSLREAAMFAYERGLTGFECLHGIPGTVGGGVFMNAGAYGGEIKDVIRSVYACDRNGNIRYYDSDELDMSYRHSIFTENGEIILCAEFGLEYGDKEKIKAKMDELLAKRRAKQPLEYRSAGSTFKRPEGSYASLLIDKCGLKGYSVGGAEVSTKHAGFVINKGSATTADILAVIAHVRQVVCEKTGYDLQTEPIILK